MMPMEKEYWAMVGIVRHFGLEGRADLEVGTLSKALGVVGGYIAGTMIYRLAKGKSETFLILYILNPWGLCSCC